MFNIGWTELALIAGAAVVVIGPQDMPRVLYKVGQFTRKIKLFMSDIQVSLDKITRDAELDEITRAVNEKIGGPDLQFEIERQIQEEERLMIAQENDVSREIKAAND